MKSINNAVTGFVAGTLVHSQNGLVPIEQINVGDYVLSKHESGNGELLTQKVINTFVHEEQQVMCVDVYGYTVNELADAESKRELIDSSKKTPLVVTPNHPFWVVGRGNVKAKNLEFVNSIIQTVVGQEHSIFDISDLMRTEDPDVGFLVGGRFCPLELSNSESRPIILKNNKIYTSYEFNDQIENDAVEWWDRNDSDKLTRTVYDIEVENTHTYFVGDIGVLVYDNSPSKT